MRAMPTRYAPGGLMSAPNTDERDRIERRRLSRNSLIRRVIAKTLGFAGEVGKHGADDLQSAAKVLLT